MSTKASADSVETCPNRDSLTSLPIFRGLTESNTQFNSGPHSTLTLAARRVADMNRSRNHGALITTLAHLFCLCSADRVNYGSCSLEHRLLPPELVCLLFNNSVTHCGGSRAHGMISGRWWLFPATPSPRNRVLPTSHIKSTNCGRSPASKSGDACHELRHAPGLYLCRLVGQDKCCLQHPENSSSGTHQETIDHRYATLVTIPLYILWYSDLPKAPRLMIRVVFAMSLLSTAVSVVHAIYGMGPDRFLDGATAHMESATNLIVCNLMVLVTFVYRRFRNGRDLDDEVTAYVTTRTPRVRRAPLTFMSFTNITQSQFTTFLSTKRRGSLIFLETTPSTDAAHHVHLLVASSLNSLEHQESTAVGKFAP
ncbi:hypothetical protein LshimejAT787_0601910 [Lyophyllum shimeji]|uniref:Uncharacterized protein n=1 Tax=Lyophyllum shimeji TaxID=47721 RepID=A0A9P3PPA0_LYOSH|nr:hypothetical protein LshimejAT787_0601910 [Lyophyllum shimeji]